MTSLFNFKSDVPRRIKGKRGSALLMALWIIAVLAVMVLSFTTEAHYESGINVYIRERNRVNRLIDAGKVIGEIIITGYNDVKDWQEGEDEQELDEEDRWYKFKRDLKEGRPCKVGPVLLDEEDPDSGTVTVELTVSNSNGFNINKLYKDGGDSNYLMLWQMVLKASGISEDLEVEVKEADGRSTKRHNLMNLLIASWNDWRDEDDTVSAGPITDDPDIKSESDDGAESAFYKEQYEEMEKEVNGRDEREAVKEKRITPPNAAIKDLKELEYIRGFKDFPAVLVGGRLNPEEEVSEENPELHPIIMNVFDVTGSSKIIINPETSVDTLMLIPGITDTEEEDDEVDARERAQAIIDTLSIPPENRDDYDETRSWWPYKDWQDLKDRVSESSNVDDIGEEAGKFIDFKPEDGSTFTMKIVGESMGMKRTVSCQCYVKDKKVRYTEWSEDAEESSSNKK